MQKRNKKYNKTPSNRVNRTNYNYIKNYDNIIIDSNCICFQSFYGQWGKNDEKIGVIYGFLRTLCGFMSQFNTTNFQFVWDSKKSLRKKLYPEYKNQRRKDLTAEEKRLLYLAYDQFQIIRSDILPALGFNNSFSISGLEGDDLIYYCGQKNKTGSSVIVSLDHDLYQLLNKRVDFYNLRSHTIFTKAQMKKELFCEPKQWGMVKAIGGCISDNVKGCTRIGEKSAIKFLNGELKNNSVAYKNITSKDGQRTIKINKPLVILPFPHKTVNITYKENTLLRDNFIKVFNQYNLNSLLDPKILKIIGAVIKQ